MPEFKRYRDEHGHEFTAANKRRDTWKDITDQDNPAVDSQGKPLPAKPADRNKAASAAKPSAPAKQDSTTSKGA